MAKHYNTFFCSIRCNLALRNISNTVNRTTINQFLTNRANASLCLEPVDEAEVVQTIKSLNFSKSVGYDNISVFLLN